MKWPVAPVASDGCGAGRLGTCEGSGWAHLAPSCGVAVALMPVRMRVWSVARQIVNFREGWVVGRDQVARVMAQLVLQGARRGRQVFTTTPDRAAERPLDLVERDFTAGGPNRLWLSDRTFVPTCAGMAYVAFVTDVFSRHIVGWSVRSTMTTEALPLEALNMAKWQATAHAHTGESTLRVPARQVPVQVSADCDFNCVQLSLRRWQ